MKQNHIVVGFEPVPTNMDLLCMSKLLGDWQYDSSRLHYVEAAASDKTGMMDIYIPIRADNSAISQTSAVKNVGGDAEKVQIYTITLDEYLETQKVESVALLKIDTQGHEYFVLKGAENSLKSRRIKAVYAENDPGLIEAAGKTQEDIYNLMISFGFLPYNDYWEQVTITRNSFVKKDGVKPLTSLRSCREGESGPSENACANYNILWLPKD